MARDTADERPRWVRALQRSMIADTGKSRGAPPPFAYGQDSSVGLSQAVKTVAPCARLCAWSRGGCDDSRGDTRLARGLPCGRMPLDTPRTRCLKEACRGRAKRGPVQHVVQAVASNGSVAPAGDAQRSERSATWTSGSRRTDMLCTAYSSCTVGNDPLLQETRRSGFLVQDVVASWPSSKWIPMIFAQAGNGDTASAKANDQGSHSARISTQRHGTMCSGCLSDRLSLTNRARRHGDDIPKKTRFGNVMPNETRAVEKHATTSLRKLAQT